MADLRYVKEYAKSASIAPLGNLYRTLYNRNRSLRILPESIKTKSLFIHVPKTGGHSVGLSLYNRDPWHFRYLDYAGYAADNDISLGEFFKFSVVRNPVERMVSMHNYYKGLKYVHFREIPLKLSPDIISFTDNWLELRGKLNNKKMRPFLYSQTEYLCGLDGKLAMDYIGRLEDISDDFKYISAKIGGSVTSLQHMNKSSKHMKLSNSDRNYVADIFADEMALFQY